ncbi:MAG TPA: peptidoglycan -binding protein [Pseudolabrys sp.]|nr:peptidoglycan -binding protein [Pseudolabrys sp.]
MALARSRRSDSGMNYWPGFVDALSTLILSIIFILTVFVVVQFYLQQEVQGKDTALDRLKHQIAQLTDLLSMEKTSKSDLQDQLATLRASLASAQAESDKYKGLYQGAGQGAAAAKDKVGVLSGQLDKQKNITANALAQVEVLNQQIAALRRQLAEVQDALDLQESKNKEAQGRITELGQRLNLALAEKVRELKGYRSEFFGKLRKILGDRPDFRIVGDRFVLQSEVFFDTNSADLKPEGQTELDKVAGALVGLEKEIPSNIPWIMRVDGHTDKRPITGGQFKSNWDLSAARAIAVVKYLISKGVKPQRLVAAGFGEFDPIVQGDTPDAYRRNRRIEFKLTER